MKRSAGVLVLLLLLLGLVGTARSESTSGSVENGDQFGDALATGDFDGDGRADLAVGVSLEDAGGDLDAGVVNVVYGSGSGLSPNGNQVWYQGTVGVGGSAEESDHFGDALVAGDFEGDGFDDLAVGVPDEDFESNSNAGVVNVIYGSAQGLTEVDNQVLTEDEVEAGEHFGAALAAGDFNGDERDDLAVGVPGQNINPKIGAGIVDVFNGSGDGLSESSTSWQQGASLGDMPEDSDGFGQVLAAGNLGAGAQDDLVIGVPAEDLDSGSEGALHVVYGSGGGLTAAGNQFWHEDIPGLEGQAEVIDSFGWSLAIANFGRGRPADLAIGAPHETLSPIDADLFAAGIVHVLYGSSAEGLTTQGDQLWHQNKRGVGDHVEPLDMFGWALTAGDFGNSKRADLAISAQNEDLESASSTKSDAGVVHVLFGSADGLTSSQDELWHQDVEGVRDSAEPEDSFGVALEAGNYGSGSRADLAVGVRSEKLGDFPQAGAANVLYGTAGGLSAAGDQFWHQTLP